MSTATTFSNISTSSRIKALGMPAAQTRKALQLLALSETLIGPFFAEPQPKAEAKSAPKIKPVLKAQ